jgi:hypothetical protein
LYQPETYANRAYLIGEISSSNSPAPQQSSALKISSFCAAAIQRTEVSKWVTNDEFGYSPDVRYGIKPLAFLRHRFRVLTTRAIEYVNLRYLVQIETPDKAHRAVAMRAWQVTRLG